MGDWFYILLENMASGALLALYWLVIVLGAIFILLGLLLWCPW